MSDRKLLSVVYMQSVLSVLRCRESQFFIQTFWFLGDKQLCLWEASTLYKCKIVASFIEIGSYFQQQHILIWMYTYAIRQFLTLVCLVFQNFSTIWLLKDTNGINFKVSMYALNIAQIVLQHIKISKQSFQIDQPLRHGNRQKVYIYFMQDQVSE